MSCLECTKYGSEDCRLKNRKGFPFKTAKCFKEKSWAEKKLGEIIAEDSSLAKKLELLRKDLIFPIVEKSVDSALQRLLVIERSQWNEALKKELNTNQIKRVLREKAKSERKITG